METNTIMTTFQHINIAAKIDAMHLMS